MFVKERGFHSRHTVLYDAKSWSDHKRHQLANRLSRQELAEKKLQQESARRNRVLIGIGLLENILIPYMQKGIGMMSHVHWPLLCCH